LLITDKSSIFTDFLHCNKPIIFIKNHKINETDKENIFTQRLPGIECEISEIEQAVDRVLSGDEFEKVRLLMREQAFETAPEASSKEINSFFARLVPELLI
jgi:CDP-glycerol glycerophosphotransferase (TagB/SpsB family)